MTRRWREMDSKFQYAGTVNLRIPVIASFFVAPARFGRVPTEHQTPPRDQGARAYDIAA